jgi:flagellar hook protein FlgE
MSIAAITGIALSGMQAQQKRVAATANNIANAMTPGYDRKETAFSSAASGGVSATVSPSGDPVPDGGSNVDLASEMLSLIQGEIGFQANAAAFETGADLWDVLKTMVKD